MIDIIKGPNKPNCSVIPDPYGSSHHYYFCYNITPPSEIMGSAQNTTEYSELLDT